MPFPPSDHCNGTTFFNPDLVPVHGLGAVIRWKLNAHPVPWPQRVDAEPQPVPPAPRGPGLAVTWVGHSTFLLQSAGCAILTDPVFSERAGPLPGLGPRRAASPGVEFDDLPKVDVVLLSHDHYDHCDLPTLRRLARRYSPVIVAPLGHRGLLKGAGFGTIIELDWWQTYARPGSADITLVPARHWCRRSPFNTNTRLWGGFMAVLGGRRVYFAGDSAYEEGLFPEIARRTGRPDLALLPIGAYEPRWFMRSSHMDPAEAVRVHRDMAAARSIGMHWGTFQLTDESRDQPVEALEAARGADDFHVLPFGGSTTI